MNVYTFAIYSDSVNLTTNGQELALQGVPSRAYRFHSLLTGVFRHRGDRNTVIANVTPSRPHPILCSFSLFMLEDSIRKLPLRSRGCVFRGHSNPIKNELFSWRAVLFVLRAPWLCAIDDNTFIQSRFYLRIIINNNIQSRFHALVRL